MEKIDTDLGSSRTTTIKMKQLIEMTIASMRTTRRSRLELARARRCISASIDSFVRLVVTSNRIAPAILFEFELVLTLRMNELDGVCPPKLGTENELFPWDVPYMPIQSEDFLAEDPDHRETASGEPGGHDEDVIPAKSV